MRDQRLPDAATEGATTLDTTPERDDGKLKPDAGPDRRQDRTGAPTEKAHEQPGGRPEPAAPDLGGR